MTETLADAELNVALARFFASRALRKTLSDEEHLSAVYGPEVARLTRPAPTGDDEERQG